MRLLLVCILTLFFFSASYAQSNYKKGYIITNENDSIHGWIDFRTTKMNVAACNFRKTENSETKTFYPGDIAGYRFLEEGKFYISRNITIDDIERTVFLEYLIKGVMDLYVYESEGNTTYYLFENEDGKMIPIKKVDEKFIYAEDTKDAQIKEGAKYKGMLKYIFRNSEDVAQKTGKVRLNERNMMKLTKEYHDKVCTTGEECIIFETKEDKEYTKVQFTIYGGIQGINEIIISSLYQNKTPLKNLSASSFGGLVNLTVPRWMKSISVNIDFSVTNFKDSYYARNYIEGIDEKHDLRILMFDYRLGSRYTYHKGPVRPFLEAYIGGTSIDSNEDIGWAPTFGIGGGINIMLGKNNAISLRSNYINRNTKSHGTLNGYSLNLGYAFQL